MDNAWSGAPHRPTRPRACAKGVWRALLLLLLLSLASVARARCWCCRCTARASAHRGVADVPSCAIPSRADSRAHPQRAKAAHAFPSPAHAEARARYCSSRMRVPACYVVYYQVVVRFAPRTNHTRRSEPWQGMAPRAASLCFPPWPHTCGHRFLWQHLVIFQS